MRSDEISYHQKFKKGNLFLLPTDMRGVCSLLKVTVNTRLSDSLFLKKADAL